MGNRVVWFTLSAGDPEELASFYERVLGWNVQQARLTSTDSGVSGTFHALETGGEISGSISAEDERGVVLMVEVDDLDVALERAHELGANAVREAYELHGIGSADGRYHVAWIEDPEGNRLALVREGAG